ncbi:hydroxymethylbilane synthase [Mariniphaga anaerophila]|uniref:Porphobilinogen deaminase n=1 Tax=Mariniphaga anaerophila TaxID=1484053 RepID=A0A1M5EIQ8_9BACT|nr:hydroxymethylbilane synthase [Mariniphaga anaerophila]SHF79046.1 hydroxymethylbilane synthase [Mariniphaga anaerophila]
MNKKTIKIGTRGSQLALFQAKLTQKELHEKFPKITVEIVVIKTKGDKILDVALSKIGDKGLFTKEIENALLANEVDIAVHSLKDLPTTLPEGLTLGAVLKRGEFRDALVSKDGRKLNELTENDVIATSSLRRKAGLLRFNKNFNIIDIRGNVNTRIQKMEEGYCDAMIMAAAGLQRLDLDKYITEIVHPETIIPAASQGIIAIESRADDAATNELLAAINHVPSWNAGEAERGFLRAIEGGCQVPVGCYSQINGDTITLTGFVASVDGTAFLTETETGLVSNSRATGEKLAQKLIERGAAKILDGIRKQ